MSLAMSIGFVVWGVACFAFGAFIVAQWSLFELRIKDTLVNKCIVDLAKARAELSKTKDKLGKRIENQKEKKS